ncbi:MAG: alanine dehydrogenase [Candidatus Omnitrophota bacterium]|nr:alanine dehydrogenase [Candidatus Omnitrophota bacterium]
MANLKTLILTRKDIKRLITIGEAIDCVEDAFREFGLGRAHMPAKIYLDLPQFHGDFRAMPAYIEKMNACSLKWVNAHPQNARYGIPSVMAVLILNDPRTGVPLAIMDATYLTSLRTGAAGGVAAKYLARKKVDVVAMVGCGVQARTQLQALRLVRRIKTVYVWGHRPELTRLFIKGMQANGEKMIFADTIKDCVCEADIIVTSTPSRAPIVKLPWIKQGAHINAIGADAPGKQELDAAILKKAKVVIDDWHQAIHSGEVNVPLRKKQISVDHIYGDLGSIVAGKKKGRTSENEITVFDSTGLAIQDTAVAHYVFQRATELKIGSYASFI